MKPDRLILLVLAVIGGGALFVRWLRGRIRREKRALRRHRPF